MQKIITHPALGEVTLSKTRRSTRITLSVRPNGAIRLSFPPWVTQRRALKFLDEKLDWIAAARQKMARKYPDLADFADLADLSNRADLADLLANLADPTQKPEPGMAAPWPKNDPEPEPPIPRKSPDPATRKVPDPATRKSLEKRVVEQLRSEAKRTLPAMVARLADEHGFGFGVIRIKLTKGRWGSCTARNDLNLSLSLVLLPEHLAEYIILHELCHTVHKNHSARFHALLDKVTGGRNSLLNRELRRHRPDALVVGVVNRVILSGGRS